jgi:hypothetical protein
VRKWAAAAAVTAGILLAVTALAVTAVAGGGGVAAATRARRYPPADSARVFHRAQRLLAHDRLRVPWDGRYFQEEDGTFCVETFNGRRHDLPWRGHQLAPGFYLEDCSNGFWQVTDGRPIRGMQSY